MTTIEFSAVVYKVQTLVDGGLRVTLDLPEQAIAQAALLMECKRTETPLVVKVTEEEPFRTHGHGNKRRERKISTGQCAEPEGQTKEGD
jgi:hypothetical protein